MKLAIDATNIGPGGGITGFGYYLKEWVKMGQPEEIIIWASRPTVIDVARSVGGQIKVVPFMVGKPSPLVFLASQLLLPKLIEKENPDVLMTTLRMLHKCKIPQLVHHRNLKWQQYEPFWKQLGKNGFKAALSDSRKRNEYYYALKHSAANVYISKYMCDLASSQYPPSETRNFPVLNGGLQSPFDDAEKQRQMSMDRGPKIIAIQSTGAHKQSEILPKIMRHLCDKAPDVDWKLIIAGTIRNEPEFDLLAEELGVADRIEKAGYLKPEKIYEMFNGALCHLFPSKVEGFGNSPLEAMAMGCPVVTSDCTAIPEVVGDAGILVEPSDAEAFADGVLKMYQDSALRSEYIQKGFEQIKNFSWKRSAEQMLNVLRQIATDK